MKIIKKITCFGVLIISTTALYGAENLEEKQIEGKKEFKDWKIEQAIREANEELLKKAFGNGFKNINSIHLINGVESSPLGEAVFWASGAFPVHQSKLDVINFFIDNKADVNAPIKNHRNLPPAHLACSLPAGIEALKILLLHGAKKNKQDDNGKTPLHYACKHSPKNLELIKLACTQTACFRRDKKGRIPLHIASKKGFLDKVKFLADISDMYLKDNNGMQPRDLAKQKNHIAIVSYFKLLDDFYSLTRSQRSFKDFANIYFETPSKKDAENNWNDTLQLAKSPDRQEIQKKLLNWKIKKTSNDTNQTTDEKFHDPLWFPKRLFL